MTSILIYQDYVHNSGALLKALRSRYDSVAYADANDIKNGILTDQVKAFFMPGGASRYVADKLDGQGNQQIKNYVANGGVYVGICAGAYYACQRTEWKKDQPDSICVENELGFFPGIAQGPIENFTRHDLDLPFTAAKTFLKTTNDEDVNALYWGGPVFLSDRQEHDILAMYQELDAPAIVAGKHGQGRYLLISPHLEIDSEQLELMHFDVIANNLRDVNALPHLNGLSKNYFFSLLSQCGL